MLLISIIICGLVSVIIKMSLLFLVLFPTDCMLTKSPILPCALSLAADTLSNTGVIEVAEKVWPPQLGPE